jgi:hypothetical protein
LATEKEKKLEFALSLKNDFEFFVNTVFGEYLTSPTPDFHRQIYDWLLKEQRICIAAPRGFAKSQIVSVFYPTYCALFGLRKDICIISASEALAIELLRKIKREFEQNKVLLSLFEDLQSPKWTESHIILKNGVNIRAKGCGGQLRGFRPDCVILDDIETSEGVVSEEQRKKLKDWVFRDCINTLLPQGQFIVVGTIIHPLSLLEDLLVTPNGWVKQRFRAYKNGREVEGEELWREARPHEWLQQRKKEIGSFAFASEFMNDPKLDEHAPIKEHQIRYWDKLPSQYSAVITVDPAYSEDDKADFKTASLIIIDQNLNRYLVSYIHNHAPTGEFQDAILNLYLANKGTITAIGVPNSGVEKAFFESFVKKMEERRIYAPVVELKNTFITASGQAIANKKNRIIATLQPLFENGKYYINADHFEAREELLTIGSSRWDDIVDTMAYAEQILTPNYEVPKETKDRYGDDIDDDNQMINNYGY